MSTLYVHAGPSKTGSTFVQHCLNKFQTDDGNLNTNIGTVPELGLNLSWLASSVEPENPLFLAPTRKAPHKDPFKLLNNRLKQTDLLISGEHFGDLTAKGFSNFKEIFDPHEIKILLFARQFESRFLSSWQESIKWGNVLSFYDSVLALITDPAQSSAFDLSCKYSAAFEGLGGSEFVSLTSLSCKKFSKDDLSKVLSNWTNRPIKLSALEVNDVNRSMSFRDAVDVVILNHVLKNVKNSRMRSAAFAIQIQGNRDKVANYLKSEIEEAIVRLEECKIQELEQLKRIDPICIEGCEKLIIEMEKDHSKRIIEYFLT